MSVRLSIILVVAAVASAVSLTAQEVSADLGATPNEQLVKLLGASTFDVRESAADELLRRGMDAKPALLAATRSPDLEVRLRIRQIVDLIDEADLQARLTAFIEDESDEGNYDLPAWIQFRERVGGDRVARELFVDMLRAESPLLASYNSDPKEAAELFSQRLQSLYTHAIPGVEQQVTHANMAALLLVGSDVDINVAYPLGYQMYNMLSRAAVKEMFTDDDRAAMMKKLLGGWFMRDDSYGFLSRNNLMLALQFEMPDVGLELAKQQISKTTQSSSVLPYAILMIGKYGEPNDAELVRPLLENSRVCHAYQTGTTTIRTQVRDVALATLVHMSGQQPKDYGFERLTEDAQMLFHVYTCGFENDEKRDAAFVQWNEWFAQQQNAAAEVTE